MKTHGAGSEQAPSPTVRMRARRAYPASRGFQKAFIRGWYARSLGKSRDANPYKGRAKNRTGGTFTFAWRAAWERGYNARKEQG